MQTWRDCLVVPDDGVSGMEGERVVLPTTGNSRTAVHLDRDTHPWALLAIGFYRTAVKVHAMTHPEFTAYFTAEWEKRDGRRGSPHAEKWEAFYEALLTEYQQRATSLNGMTPPGLTREEFRKLWESEGKADEAYVAAVQGVFNAVEVTSE